MISLQTGVCNTDLGMAALDHYNCNLLWTEVSADTSLASSRQLNPAHQQTAFQPLPHRQPEAAQLLLIQVVPRPRRSVMQSVLILLVEYPQKASYLYRFGQEHQDGTR